MTKGKAATKPEVDRERERERGFEEIKYRMSGQGVVKCIAQSIKTQKNYAKEIRNTFFLSFHSRHISVRCAGFAFAWSHSNRNSMAIGIDQSGETGSDIKNEQVLN